MEIWKTIEGYSDYEVSNLGRVKSFKMNKETVLKPSIDKLGYQRVSLSGKSKTVHQLVAMSFLNHTPCGYEKVVDHINFDPSDNRVENLRVVTHSENMGHRRKTRIGKYTGAHWHPARGKYVAAIGIKDKTIYLGAFDNEEKASEVYQEALKKHLMGLPVKDKEVSFASAHKGVYFNKNNSLWFSSIRINRKQKYLGYFHSELEAHQAYQAVAELL